MEKTRLILGAAGKNPPDAITLDIDPQHHPDVIYDLNRTPWPFRDNQFKFVSCHHVLEHLSDLPPVMRELHRICAPGGRVSIEVPHFSSWMAHAPEHKLHFSYFSFDSYLAQKEKTWLLTDFKFDLIEKRLTFHRTFRRYLLHRLWNKFPLSYERFWTYLMPAEHLILVLQPLK